MLDSDGRPLHVTWEYDRAELVADGIVHATGIALAVIGAIALALAAIYSSDRATVVSVAVYLVGLLAMIGVSAAYNLWPVSPAKWLLRRFDHSAIYLLIAGTYTPVIAQTKAGSTTIGLLIGIWLTATAGIALKLLLPGRLDWLSIALYLLMGWSGIAAWPHVVAALTSPELVLLGIGGMLYSGGVIFHIWRGLRFQNAIWHGFVLAAAACHYAAVLLSVA